jgi:PAT family beta-lactamase induction signal transducer AmpG
MDNAPKSLEKTHPFEGYGKTLKATVQSPRNAAMLCLGASAGLPIMLVYQVLSIWMREADVSRSTIGFFVWVGFAYSLKFLWAPLVDRIRIPGFSSWLGNRRGWTLFATLGTAMAMFAMSQQDPATDLQAVAVCAVLIAFASATLDICVDAWRVDNASNSEQAMVSAIYQLGYRFGMIAAVTGGLFLADIGGFNLTYLMLGLLAMIGASTPLWAPDVSKPVRPGIHPFIGLILGLVTLAIISTLLYFGLAEGGWLRLFIGAIGAILEYIPSEVLGSAFSLILFLPFILAGWFISPLGRKQLETPYVYAVPILGDFADIVRRTGAWSLLILAMVVSYRISDTTMGVMTGPLYIDLGYDKSTIGAVKGAFGITILIIGAFWGGLLATRRGLAKAMIVGAILTILTNFAFAWLAQVNTPRAIYLFVTIGADNIAAGFAGSVFIAFMSIMTNKRMSATQYALLSSLFAFYGKSLAGFSGKLADFVGYETFFIITSIFGVPALLLAIWAARSKFTDGINDDGVPNWGPFVDFRFDKDSAT